MKKQAHLNFNDYSKGQFKPSINKIDSTQKFRKNIHCYIETDPIGNGFDSQ